MTDILYTINFTDKGLILKHQSKPLLRFSDILECCCYINKMHQQPLSDNSPGFPAENNFETLKIIEICTDGKYYWWKFEKSVPLGSKKFDIIDTLADILLQEVNNNNLYSPLSENSRNKLGKNILYESDNERIETYKAILREYST